MKKVIFVLMFIAMSAFTMSAQVRFAANADVYMKIPMEGQVESLNAAVASVILMYEAARQRMV